MYNIWYRNPSKSEVIGGDEKNEWPRRTDKSRTLKRYLKKIKNGVIWIENLWPHSIFVDFGLERVKFTGVSL